MIAVAKQDRKTTRFWEPSAYVQVQTDFRRFGHFDKPIGVKWVRDEPITQCRRRKSTAFRFARTDRNNADRAPRWRRQESGQRLFSGLGRFLWPD
jgi:hypothetical protein